MSKVCWLVKCDEGLTVIVSQHRLGNCFRRGNICTATGDTDALMQFSPFPGVCVGQKIEEERGCPEPVNKNETVGS